MSVSLSSSQRRLSLLASSSLAALTLATSVGLGAAVTLTPGVAAAQDECGAVNGNGAGPDVFVCSGAYPTGITYTTNGNLVLGLQGLVSLPAQGLNVTGSVGDNVALIGVDGVGDIHINNAVSNGINVTADGGGILIDIQSDAGDGLPTIVGGAFGIRAFGSNGGDVLIDIENGSVEGGVFEGIYAQQVGSGDVTVDFGLTSVEGAGGIRAISSDTGSGVIVTGFGYVTATAANLDGIAALGNSGGVVIDAAGGVASARHGVVGQTLNGGDVTIDATLVTAADIGVAGQAGGGGSVVINTYQEVDAGGTGVSGVAAGGGDVSIQINGALTAGGTAILAGTDGVGDIEITTHAPVTGGQGIVADSVLGDITLFASGDVTATSSSTRAVELTSVGGDIFFDNSAGGVISSEGRAITLITGNDGSITANVGNVDTTIAGFGFGAGLMVETEHGDIDVAVTGSIETNNRGLQLESETGDINVSVAAGASVGGVFAGIEIESWEGAVNVDVAGTSRAIQIETGASAAITVMVSGSVTAGAAEHGIDIDGGSSAVHVGLTGSGSVTVGASSGSAIFVETGSHLTVNTAVGTSVHGGTGASGSGIHASSVAGNVVVEADGDIFAGSVGINVSADNGGGYVYLGDGATIDPADIGISSIAADTALVATGAGSTIIIGNVDGDDIAVGILAVSSAATDAGPGVPSVQVSLGATSLITVDDGAGGEADGGFGVHAQNTGGGTGGIAISAADGFEIQMVGDGVGGLVGQTTGAGDISIVTGTGAIDIQAGDGVDNINNLPFSAGVLASSGGGHIFVQTDADISVDGMAAGVTTFGIVAQTSSGGVIDLTTEGLVQATHNGIRAVGNNGDISITANNVVVGVVETGISALSSGGDISITNNALVAGGDIGILAFSGSGDVLIDSNFQVLSGGIGIQGATGGAGAVTITATNIIADGGPGVSALTADGAISISTTGLVDVTGSHGLFANSMAGDISIANLGQIGADLTGIVASTAGPGGISVNAGNIIANTGAGVDVETENGLITIAAGGDIQSFGAGLAAATTAGRIDIAHTGSIATSSGDGVRGLSDSGDIAVINSGQIVTGGSGDGIDVNTASGIVTITNTGAINASDNGIESSASGSGSIFINAGDIVAASSGVNAFTDTGAIGIVSGGTILAGTWGVLAEVVGGVGGINVAVAGGSITGGAGVTAIVQTGSGDVMVTSAAGTSILALDSNGVQATADLGDVLVDVDGEVIALDGNGIVASGDGDVTVLTGAGAVVGVTGYGVLAVGGGVGDVSVLVGNGGAEGAFGVSAISTGTGDVLIRSTANADIVGVSVGILADTGAGDISINVDGDVLSGGYGIFADSTGGDIRIETGPGDVTAGSGIGIRAMSQTGSVDIIAGGDVSGFIGIQGTAQGSGDVTIQTGAGTITANDTGVSGVSLSGDVSITTGGTIGVLSGGAVFGQSQSGGVSINNGAMIAGGGTTGVMGLISGGAGDLTILNTGDIGSAGDPMTAVGVFASIGAGGTGDITVSSDGDVFGGLTGVSAQNQGTGDLSVGIGAGAAGTITSGGVTGIDARISNAASDGVLNVTVGDGSTILGGVRGILTRNDGTGGTTVTLGDNVVIDPDDFGVDMQGGGDQTFIAGTGLIVIVGNTDNDTIAIGLNVISTAAANSAVNDPAVEVMVGNGLDITIDDGAGGDADGAIGINAAAVMAGTAGVRLILEGPAITIAGDNAIGIRAATDDGAIGIRTGDGLIDMAGGDGTDTAGNFGFSAGIAAFSDGGSITINNDADIYVANLLAGGAIGILAESVTGDVRVDNGGVIEATGSGIVAVSLDGDISIVSEADVTGVLGNGLEAQSSSGSVSIAVGSGTTVQAGSLGLLGVAASLVDISVGSGATINAGAAGIVASSDGAAVVTLGDDVTIDPEDYGVVMFTGGEATFVAGNGLNVVVGNTDADATAIGIGLYSSADLDVAAGDATIELVVGDDFSLGIDDGFGGDADGAAGILADATDTGSTASIDLAIGDGLSFTIAGDNSFGILAQTTDGDINVRTGSGLIIMGDGDGTDTAGNYGFAAGVAAMSSGGDVSIDNSAEVFINNAAAGSAFSVYAETGGDGDVSVVNSGGLLSSETGIYAFADAGDVSVSNSAGIFAAAGQGVLAVSAGGSVSVTQGPGTTVTAGDHGLIAMTSGGAGDVQVDNGALINANLVSGAGVGILTSHGGVGNLAVTNTGDIAGSAHMGIQSVHLAQGDLSVVNAGDLGSVADVIAAIGINAAIIDASNGGRLSVISSGAIHSGVLGLRATHNGSGSLSIVNSGEIRAGAIAIDALAAGGALGVSNSGADIGGGQYGIRTSNAGTGVTIINATGLVFGAQMAGFAGISAATTGAGAISVSTESVIGVLGSAVRTTSNGGAVTLNLGAGLATSAAVIGAGADASSWVVDLNNAAGGTSTVNIGSNTLVRSSDGSASGYDDLVMRGIGGSVVVNNAGQLHGRLNFSGLTGNLVFNNSSAFTWHTTGLSVFSAGADVITNTAAGSILTSAAGATTTWDFGAGLDTFNNAGLLVVGEQGVAASTLAFSSLERWNNSGRVMFGLNGNTLDGQANDRILAPGAVFTGSAGSLLVMDVNLGSIVQTGCGVLTAADCLSLTGGSTAGVTGVLVNDISGTPEGVFNPGGIVLVDVTGGTTGAGHFVLDPGSSFWRADASADGVLDKGLFVYDLILNGAQQHMLVGVPDSEAFEFPSLGEATQSLWHSSTGAWFERQADLRDRLETVASPAVWIKTSTVDQDRDTSSTWNVLGSSYTYDTSHDQQTTAVVAGADLISGETMGGARWVAGAMLGYIDSDVTFDQSSTRYDLSGVSIGAYGTLVQGPAFVHGLLAANQLSLEYDAPSLAAGIPDGQVDSWGFQAEGGYTVQLGDRTFLEPLVGIARVHTSIETLNVPGATINWEDQTSLRLSLGGRIGVAADYRDLQTRFSLTGRVWHETDAANRTLIDIGGSSVATLDDFGGTFSELSGAVNLDSRRISAFSAFLTAGLKWNDDYRAIETAAGIRYRW